MLSRVIETMRGVIIDLDELVKEMPVPQGHAEAKARILERLAEEITEAAGLVRALYGQQPEGGR